MTILPKAVLLAIASAHIVVGAALSNLKSQAHNLQDDNWYKYIRSPESRIVKPQSILSTNTTGNVTNPNGLLGADNSVTVLMRNEGDPDVPTVIVDFGQNVVGIVSIDFAGSSNSSEGFPGLKVAFSETQQYLTNTSDFTRSDNMADVSYFQKFVCKACIVLTNFSRDKNSRMEPTR